MRKLSVAFTILILMSGCFSNVRKKIPPLSDREKSRVKLDSAHFRDRTAKLIEQTKICLDTLKKLSVTEKKALASLLVITSDISSLSPGDRKYNAYKDSLAQEVNKYFGDVPVVNTVDVSDYCLSSEISYADAVRRCKEENKTESQCEEAWASSVESINCAEDRLNAKLARIVEIQKK